MRRDRSRRIASTEAWWRPVTPADQTLSGKLEWDRFATGRTEISLYVRKLSVAEHTTVEAVRGDEVLISCQVGKGRARHTVDSATGGHVPELRVGDEVELRAADHVLARATVETD